MAVASFARIAQDAGVASTVAKQAATAHLEILVATVVVAVAAVARSYLSHQIIYPVGTAAQAASVVGAGGLAGAILAVEVAEKGGSEAEAVARLRVRAELEEGVVLAWVAAFLWTVGQ